MSEIFERLLQTESMKELESLLNIATEKILNDEDFRRLDLHTNEARISIYKVSEKLVRIDIAVEK